MAALFMSVPGLGGPHASGGFEPMVAPYCPFAKALDFVIDVQ
jgi:hypothetical protein